MDTETLERSEPLSYPHKQVRKLTDNQKVELVIQKEVRPTSTSTNKRIAQDFDVSEGLVSHTNYESLTDTQKALYHQKVDDLKYHALDLTYDCVLKAKTLAKTATSIKDLPAIMGAAKIGNDIYRLETNQATSITQDNNTKAITTLANVLREHNAYYQQFPNAQPTPKEYYLNIVVAIAPNADPQAVYEQAQKQLTE